MIPMRARFSFIIFAVVLVCAVIIVRLFYWQIIKGGELAAQASQQYNFISKISPKRGEVYFRGREPFVMNQPGYLVVAHPPEIEDKLKFSEALGSVLEKDPASISAVLSDKLYWVPIEHKIDDEVRKKIEDLQIKGVTFEEEPLRFYPEASMAAHISGFIGSDLNGDDKGYFGLEGFYDREIRGRGSVIQSFIDALGRPILLEEPTGNTIINGRDLVLHIDRTVQFIVEEQMNESLGRFGAKGGSVIVMDPKTGGILAMASYPSYDQSKWPEYEESLYKNPAIAGTYEPGSTFKVLVMAAGINEGLVEPDTICDICNGPISIGGFIIRTWNDKYFNNTNMLEVIQHSDNTGMVFVAKKLGFEKFYDYIGKFGFGKPTGIDLEDEESPQLRSQESWREIDLATGSFGQGIAVTPMQMIRAVAAIANGGNIVEPHIVKFVIKEDGTEIPISPKIERDVISEKTAKIVTEMMVNAVDNGEAKFAKPRGYRIAGKTGTAQIPIAGNYDPTKTIASFIGFAPANDPKFVMLVKVDEPTSSPFGSETAAPLFFNIAKRLFTYYNIPPSK